MPAEERENYIKLLLKHHNVFSLDKKDIRMAMNLRHRIYLKDKEPTYRKQFPIPDAHKGELESIVTEWLKMGLIQPSRSRYNSPLFMVTKKDGSLRVVQDFSELNAKSMDDRYSMKDECI